jgi:protein-tyrosine phosphatase
MKKIMFVCHGNICRSPIAEILFNRLLEDNNDSRFKGFSGATSSEEIGNDIYQPMKLILLKNKIYTNHLAYQIKLSDKDKYDMFVVMDDNNYYNLKNRFLGDDEKIYKLGDFYDHKDIEDPWYTRRFEYVYNQILNDLKYLYKSLCEEK